ncbi:MAG TPA: hypothetical protein DCY27_04365 [Desulfobacterales bacterium]|nr:hypothetical protein [Desulfobacterales bacterium]
MKRLCAVAVFLLILCPAAAAFAFSMESPLKLFVNGKDVSPLSHIYQGGKHYLPVEDIAHALGHEITVAPGKVMIQEKLPGKTYLAEDEYLSVKILPLENYSTNKKYDLLDYRIKCRAKYASSVEVNPAIIISKVLARSINSSDTQMITPYPLATENSRDIQDEDEFYSNPDNLTGEYSKYPPWYEIGGIYLVATSMYNPEPPYTIRLKYTIDKPLVPEKEERTLIIPVD